MAALGLSTTFGFATVKNLIGENTDPGTIAYTESPGYPTTEIVLGGVQIGADYYELRNFEGAQYHEKITRIYKNNIYWQTMTLSGTVGEPIGFCCQYTSATVIQIFALIPPVAAASAQTWYTSQSQIYPTSLASYISVLLYEGADSVLVEDTQEEWDEGPSTDPENNPENLLPEGGEFADRDLFSDTFMQYLADLLEPDTIDYGSFMTAYQLTNANIGDIGSALFAPNFWTSLKNKFEGLSDPLSMIVSAVEIPFTLGTALTTFKLGGIEVEDSNGDPISCSKHTDRYLKYDFGTITLKEVWGTAKDYTDCDISIFLPYVGMRQIDAEIAVNANLKLGCIVDVWNGDLVYLLEVNNVNRPGKYVSSSGVPYRWSGNCGNRIPIGKVDPSSPILNVAASLGSMALGAGMMLSGGIGAGAAAVTGGMVTAGSAVSGGIGGAMMLNAGKGLMQDFSKGFSPLAQSSGNISGAIGYMDYQYPYIVIKRSVPKYPNNWRAQFGAPRFQTFQGLSVTGFTQFADIHLTGMSDASEAERAELERLLKEEGIIL